MDKMGNISSVRPRRFLLLWHRGRCCWNSLMLFLCVCVVCRLFSCKPRHCHRPDETRPPARSKYIFPHFCPECALSESPSLYMAMNMGISGSKVFSFLSPDENLSETLDLFTYLAPQRSAVEGKVGCAEINSSKTPAADKVLPEASHRLTSLWPWIINEQDRVVTIRRRLPVNDYRLHWVHWVHWVRICIGDENVKMEKRSGCKAADCWVGSTCWCRYQAARAQPGRPWEAAQEIKRHMRRRRL